MADKLPRALTQRARDIFTKANEYQSADGYFRCGDIAVDLYGEDADTAQIRGVSSYVSQGKGKGFFDSVKNIPGGWKLSKKGLSIVQNLDNITVAADYGPRATGGQKTKKKIPLKDIQPVQLAFAPNLSNTATSLANNLGAVLDENQTYRDFLKQQLQIYANFFNAQIIYPEDKDNDSDTENQ
jgi:hypothetical protein